MEILNAMDAWITALLLAVTMFGAYMAGNRWGARLRASGKDPTVGKFDEASLALLGLLLAFSFSMALDKHQKRREAVVAEANAIADFLTCVSMLPEPSRTAIQDVTRTYADHRLAASRGRVDPARLDNIYAQARLSHERMTTAVADAVGRGTPITTPLVNTLNGVTSIFASRTVTVYDRLPGPIIALLFLGAVLPVGLVGRGHAGASDRSRASLFVFIGLVVLVVYITLDLNQPHRGLVTVGQEPLERLVDSMGPPSK